MVAEENIELEIVKMCGEGPVLSSSDPYPTTANLLFVIGICFSFNDLSIRFGKSYNDMISFENAINNKSKFIAL